MKYIVTGAAGFIGSHLTEHLLQSGHKVIGIDSFTDYYSHERKEQNIETFHDEPGFELYTFDLAKQKIPSKLMDGVDTVFHLAAQAGVRDSFGDGFETYVRHNVLATQRLLEDMVSHGVTKLVFASSSSVYGNQKKYPVDEDAPLRAHSPYGVTKMAAEALVTAYCNNFGLRARSLRYFTVFGPRQRPDMAFSKFIYRLTHNESITLYGNGQLWRDYTYVSDVVNATVHASHRMQSGHSVYNIGGGNLSSNLDVLTMLQRILQRSGAMLLGDCPSGDVRRTESDCAKAESDLSFHPKMNLLEGLRRQVEWWKAHA